MKATGAGGSFCVTPTLPPPVVQTGEMMYVVAMGLNFLNTPEGKDFEFTGPSFSGSKWFGFGAGIAVRKQDPELRDAFNTAIDAIRADGTYDRIRSAHFGFDIYGE